mgnify:CR=1 FL=1
MTAEGIVVYGKSKLLWCVIVALFVTIVALLSPSKKEEGGGGLISIVENTKDIKIIEVPLNPEIWSDWVELPMNFKNWEFGTTSSWVEFQFLNGEHHKFKADEKSWWKNTPCRTFKLRGATGKATIVVKL